MGAIKAAAAKRPSGFKQPNLGRPISSTPSNKLRSNIKGPLGQMMANTHGMVVPQQSQMFTSFGVPPGRGGVGAQQSLSQRKQVALKRKAGAAGTSATFSKKKLKGA